MTTNNLYANLLEDGIEIKCKIYDKFGAEYSIEGHLSASGFHSSVYSEIHSVGRINWTVSDDKIMTIADLIIFEFFGKKPLWSYILPFLYKYPSYKGRGLGSAMLKVIIEFARVLNVSEIRGWIAGDDLEAIPYLPELYRKHGFIVNDSNLTFYQILE